MNLPSTTTSSSTRPTPSGTPKTSWVVPSWPSVRPSFIPSRRIVSTDLPLSPLLPQTSTSCRRSWSTNRPSPSGGTSSCLVTLRRPQADSPSSSKTSRPRRDRHSISPHLEHHCPFDSERLYDTSSLPMRRSGLQRQERSDAGQWSHWISRKLHLPHGALDCRSQLQNDTIRPPNTRQCHADRPAILARP